jgi:NitT/TauT family transport system substrate-binding protein
MVGHRTLQNTTPIGRGRRLPLFFTALAALLGVHVISGGENAAATEPQVVHVAVAARAISALPLFVALDRGYFAGQGLDVKFDYFGAGPAAMASLVGGSSQFLYGALEDGLKAVKRGLPIVVTMTGLARLTCGLVIRKDIADKLGHKPTVADLKGLRIGTLGRGGFTDLATRYTLISAGINPDKDATLIPIQGGDRQIAAGEAKAVDANMLSDPFSVLAVEKLGTWSYIINFTAGEGPEVFDDFGFSMVETSKSYLASNRQTVEKMMHAIVRAQNYIADPTHLDNLLKIALKEFPKNDPAVLRRVIKNAAPAWKPAVLSSMITKNVKLLQTTGQIKGTPPAYNDIVETSLSSIWKEYSR